MLRRRAELEAATAVTAVGSIVHGLLGAVARRAVEAVALVMPPPPTEHQLILVDVCLGAVREMPGAAHDAALGRPPHGAHSTVQAEAGARVYTTYSATTCAQPRLLVTYSCEM